MIEATTDGAVATTEFLEVGLVRLSMRDVHPSPVNDVLYKRASAKDPATRKLAKSIQRHGLLTPIVVTRDSWILSGHRRYAACKLLRRKQVDCQVVDVWAGQPDFAELLIAYNDQRIKTPAEMVRESLATQDPERAYEALIEHREAHARVSGDFIDVQGVQNRKEISEAKKPMLRAIQKIVEAQRDYWPLSDRSIHYELLNDPPLRHAAKPESRYTNDPRCYKDLTELLTRARLSGFIPFECIDDPTRTSQAWGHLHANVGSFVDDHRKNFLMDYQRNLQQSQPNHIEIVAEKNTVESSVSPVAFRYGIPYTVSRGYPSIDARWKMHERFKASGKDNLIVLVLSDFDPEGEDIAHSIAKSLRDDFAIENVDVMKVGLTHKQAVDRNLPQTFGIKKSSSRYPAFAKKYGDRAHELEALSAPERSRLLTEAIDGVLDTAAFNAELAREKEDAATIAAVREQVLPMLLGAMGDQKTD